MLRSGAGSTVDVVASCVGSLMGDYSTLTRATSYRSGQRLPVMNSRPAVEDVVWVGCCVVGQAGCVDVRGDVAVVRVDFVDVCGEEAVG